MLVIRRRVGETLVIGDDVEVEILDAGPSQVKLGIRAPREVGVVRKEIRVVGEQNQLASRPIPAGDVADLLKRFKPASHDPIRPV